MTIQTLAAAMSAAFEGRKRTNGDDFRCLRDGSPEWMTEIVRDAHGDLLPDDFRYSMIEECLDQIAEDGEDATEPESEVYTGKLLAWLSSNLNRVAYVDEAADEFGTDAPRDLVGRLQFGQAMEYREILNALIDSLRERAESEEESEDDAEQAAP